MLVAVRIHKNKERYYLRQIIKFKSATNVYKDIEYFGRGKTEDC